MEKSSMELISAAYTVYSLINPADRVIISIDSFAEAYKANLAVLENTYAPVRQNSPGEVMTEKKAEDSLQKGFQEAEKTLDDKEKLSTLLKKLKQKMKTMPMVGSILANVPTMFKLLNSYLKGEYTDIPRKQLIIIVSAVSYLVSPIDLIPDFVPVVGLIDDIAVVTVCIKATQDTLEKYLTWRQANGLNSETED